MKKHAKHVLAIVLTFIVLVGSDIGIGMFGHFSGSTDNDFTVDSFVAYITTLTFTEFATILVVALAVWFIIWRLTGV